MAEGGPVEARDGVPAGPAAEERPLRLELTAANDLRHDDAQGAMTFFALFLLYIHKIGLDVLNLPESLPNFE